METPERVSGWNGFHVVENHDKRQSISLGGSRDYYYKHPDAPDVALITVLRGEHIMTVEPGDKEYPALYLLLQAQKSIEQLVKEKTSGDKK